MDGWYCDWYIDDNTYSITITGAKLGYQPTHQFHTPGLHTVNITLHWYDGIIWKTLTTTHQVEQLEWSIINGLTYTPPIYINETNTYTPSISGDILYAISVSYLIDDIIPIDNYGLHDTFQFIFDFSNTHTITQTVYYHTGFGEIKTQVHVFNILMSGIADFYEIDDRCGIMYESTSEPGQQPIMYYQWNVLLNDVIIATLGGEMENVFRYNWPTTGDFSIYHAITDGLGNIYSISKNYEIHYCRHEGSGGGGGSDKIIYRNKPLPKIGVRLKRMKKSTIKIDVKLINMD